MDEPLLCFTPRLPANAECQWTGKSGLSRVRVWRCCSQPRLQSVLRTIPHPGHPEGEAELSAAGLRFQSFASDLVADDLNQSGDVFLSNIGTLDMDADGLDDTWEMTYFSDLSRDGSGDFDHDGATDAVEFRSGTDPTNSGSFLQVLLLTRSSAGLTTAIWNSVPGKTHRLQFKASLAGLSRARRHFVPRLLKRLGFRWRDRYELIWLAPGIMS